jgi:hypothetical protein
MKSKTEKRILSDTPRSTINEVRKNTDERLKLIDDAIKYWIKENPYSNSDFDTYMTRARMEAAMMVDFHLSQKKEDGEQKNIICEHNEYILLTHSAKCKKCGIVFSLLGDNVDEFYKE